MGVGMSVSVDSLLEPTVNVLSRTAFPLTDPIYMRLLNSVSCPSEIFLLDPLLISSLVHSPGDNLKNTISTCLELLVSDDSAPRVNSAACLSRIFPFLCTPNAPIPFESYLLTQATISGIRKTSPGCFIVESTLNLLISFEDADPSNFIENIELHIPVFDLLALTVFCLSYYFHNPTLYHQMIVVSQDNVQTFSKVLFSYVSLGGRRESLISVLTLLLFHPSDVFARSQIEYIEQGGGQLSRRLCSLTNENSDYLCLLCSLAMLNDDATPAVWTREAPLVRLGLAKVLFNSTMDATAGQLVSAYRVTGSPIARALMSKVSVVSQDAREKCPPMYKYLVTELHHSDVWVPRVGEIVAQAYLFIKSYLFAGTGLTQSAPSFSEIDSIVSEIEEG